MNVNGKHYRTIWPVDTDKGITEVIDQRELPHAFVIARLESVEDYAIAIKDMMIRGAGLIGATAAWGMAASACAAAGLGNGMAGESGKEGFLEHIEADAKKLVATRPTAKNLEWAVEKQLGIVRRVIAENPENPGKAAAAAVRGAAEITDSDAGMCRNIGNHGVEIIREIFNRKKADGVNDPVVNILTHCNAGWLAFVDYGSATAPVYQAFAEGIPVHVWVDETRPRGQGASLTAWELLSHGVPHDVIADNAGGHIMQHGLVDMVITGADRVTAGGDAANKIGTYLKALAARDNNIPFYVALPSSTFDWDITDGVREIPIEERSQREVKYARGRSASNGKIDEVLLTPEDSPARNWGFDVTPARLITGLITERGVCKASPEGIAGLFPEYCNK